MVTNFCPRKYVFVLFFQIHLEHSLYTKTSICRMIHGKEQDDNSVFRSIQG